MTLLFLAVPMGRFINAYPVNISLAVGCSSDGLTLTDLDSINCDFQPSANLSLKVEECGYLCLDSQSGYFHEINVSLSADHPHHKFLNGLFFRDDWNLKIDCSTNENCQLKRVNRLEKEIRKEIFNQVKLINTSFSSLFILQSATLSNGQLFIQQTIQCDSEYDRPLGLIQPLTFKLNNSLKSDQGVIFFSSLDSEPSTDDAIINYKMCRPQCLVRARRSDICANQEHVVVFDPEVTFWSYLTLRIFYGFSMAGSSTLFEGACLAVATEVKGDFGLQRIFGLIGVMIFAPISGAMVDFFSIDQLIADYR